jgi:hypothetical protein
MSKLQDVEYKVVLVFPGFGSDRENAEQIVEEALHYLNTEKDEPGMRFAQNVTARLEMVADVEQAQAKLQTDDDLAMMILHGLPQDEKVALTAECAEKGVPVCHTVEPKETPGQEPRSSGARDRRWNVVIRKRREDELRAHTILETTLTAPLDEDPEEVMDRVGQLIAFDFLGLVLLVGGLPPPPPPRPSGWQHRPK